MADDISEEEARKMREELEQEEKAHAPKRPTRLEGNEPNKTNERPQKLPDPPTAREKAINFAKNLGRKVGIGKVGEAPPKGEDPLDELDKKLTEDKAKAEQEAAGKKIEKEVREDAARTKREEKKKKAEDNREKVRMVYAERKASLQAKHDVDRQTHAEARAERIEAMRHKINPLAKLSEWKEDMAAVPKGDRLLAVVDSLGGAASSLTQRYAQKDSGKAKKGHSFDFSNAIGLPAQGKRQSNPLDFGSVSGGFSSQNSGGGKKPKMRLSKIGKKFVLKKDGVGVRTFKTKSQGAKAIKLIKTRWKNSAVQQRLKARMNMKPKKQETFGGNMDLGGMALGGMGGKGKGKVSGFGKMDLGMGSIFGKKKKGGWM